MKRYLLVAAFAVVAILGAVHPEDASACPNEALRSGASSRLPDCRAYEMVSPVDKGGSDAFFQTLGSFASPDGDRVVYGSLNPFAGSPNSINSQYLSARTPTGWTTTPVSMPILRYHFFNSVNLFSDFACDGCASVIGTAQESANPGDDDPGPFGDAADVYVSGGPGDYEWISGGEIGGTEQTEATYAGRSADGAHVAFDLAEALIPEAQAVEPGAQIAYERDHGVLRIVGRDVAGNVMTGGAEIGSGVGGSNMRNAISADGSRIFFQSGGRLYLREGGVTTTAVSAPQCSVGGCGTGQGKFVGASRDGSVVFFKSAEKLVDGDEDGVEDLYRYEVASGALSVLGMPQGQPLVAPSIGVIRVSDDGSHLYLVSRAALTTQGNSRGQTPQEGGTNLYGLTSRPGQPTQPGDVHFIAPIANTLTGSDLDQAAVSPAGGLFMFLAKSSQPGDLPGEEGAYLYRVADDELTCISCPAGGNGGGALLGPTSAGMDDRSNLAGSEAEPIAFFESSQPLVLGDGNDKPDVYEYRDGRLSLISSGNSPAASRFVGASASGATAFIATFDPLLPQDGDQLADVYAARVDGGFPRAESPPASCEGGDCQPSQPPPAAMPPGSANAGPGNQARRRCAPPRKRAKKAAPKTHKRRHASASKKAKRAQRKARQCRNGGSNR